MCCNNYDKEKKIIENNIKYIYCLGPTGPTGSMGPQGIQGATGPTGSQGIKGDKGESGILFYPKYGLFSNSNNQSMQFSTSQVGFFKFNTTENAEGMQLLDDTTITINESGIYQVIIQFQITDNYNVRYVGLYLNDVLTYTLNRSVVNGNYTSLKLIKINPDDTIKIGAELLRIGVAANFTVLINKIDE